MSETVYTVKLSFEKVITFSGEVELDEMDYLHLQNLKETRPHSFLLAVMDRVDMDECGDNYNTAPDMELLETKEEGE